MLATCQLKRYHTQFQEVDIRSIPISDFSGQCEWHSNGRVMAGNGMVCVNPSLKRQGNSRGTAWEQHGNGMVCGNPPVERQVQPGISLAEITGIQMAPVGIEGVELL
jgi:hypothetical protein